MSTPRTGRVVRSYTSARRHGFKIGKFGDVQVPFGPYTPAQLVVMVAGAILLIRTFSVWKVLGPLPVIAWLVAVWAVRGSTIGGRSPLAAAWGWCLLAVQPRQGRIAGRAARAPRSSMLRLSFTVGAPAPATGEAGMQTARRVPSPSAAAPASALGQLLKAAGSPGNGEELA